MGASANPSGAGGGGGAAAGRGSNGGAATGTVAQVLRHDPGLSMQWSSEEQAILDEGINKFASDPLVVRYAKIAMQLPEKTVRDVALRCRWMSKKEMGKKRKEELNSARRNRDKKERVADPSTKPPAHLAARPNVAPYAIPVLPADDDDVPFEAIGGPTGQLLEHNAQILHQISSNLTNMQIQENISLLCRTRNNILAIMKEMNDVPDIMKQMPAIPVKLNEELANSILPRDIGPNQT